MPGFFGDLEDEDGFTELEDAVIDRVDLVKSPANGRPFVLMKAAAGESGFISPVQVRALISKGTTTMPVTGKRRYRIVKGKDGKPQLAVYDENGKLLGLIDPKDLTEVQTAGDTEQKQADQQAAAVQAAHDPQEQAAEQVTKALQDVLAGLKPRPNLVKKSWGGTTVTEGFKTLLAELDPSRQTALKATVANESLRAMTSFGIPASRAISITKRAAVQLGRAQGLI